MNLLIIHAATVWATVMEDGPKPEDVKAGWTAFAVFALLILAVALLMLSLVRHLRKVARAKESGVYGDDR
ncbi:hypothetical protein [Nocardioides limicola]|uniref:hypothetical protein n=1 Tax=Nocardioides limicola TaxID=2803368 RepID=UPI00193BFDA3|nr:hypothetical protein [Nocardioides sp. DJM-14]